MSDHSHHEAHAHEHQHGLEEVAQPRALTPQTSGQ